MASRSMQYRQSEAVSVAPASRSANGATNGTSVDTAGFEGVMLLAIAGAVTDGTHTFKLQESDDNATFTDVAGSDVIGGVNALVLNNGAANSALELSYMGGKRYVRAVCTVAGATTGGVTGGLIVLGYGRHLPA